MRDHIRMWARSLAVVVAAGCAPATPAAAVPRESRPPSQHIDLPPTPPADPEPVPSASTGVLRGVVRDIGAEGILVIVTSSYLPQTRSAQTDHNGFYELDQLPAPARYLVTFFAPDSGVTIERNAVTDRDKPTVLRVRIRRTAE